MPVQTVRFFFHSTTKLREEQFNFYRYKSVPEGKRGNLFNFVSNNKKEKYRFFEEDELQIEALIQIEGEVESARSRQ